MARYHDTGTICEATKRACPLGLSDGEHIEADSPREFEAKLAERFTAAGDAFGTVSKDTQSQVEAHPWAGKYLAAANSVNRDPKKGDWVAYEDSYNGGRILSGKVTRIGKKGGFPYIAVSAGEFEADNLVWPEGRPGDPKKKSALAVRSSAALNGDEDNWYPRIGGKDSDFSKELETWDEVDFVVFEARRNALTGDHRLHWDNPEDEEAYKERWRERYAQADAEMAARRESGDLGPRRIVADTPKPKTQGNARGSIASYREMDDAKIESAYINQSYGSWDGKGRGDLAKIERVMQERGLKVVVPLRPWD